MVVASWARPTLVYLAPRCSLIYLSLLCDGGEHKRKGRVENNRDITSNIQLSCAHSGRTSSTLSTSETGLHPRHTQFSSHWRSTLGSTSSTAAPTQASLVSWLLFVLSLAFSLRSFSYPLHHSLLYCWLWLVALTLLQRFSVLLYPYTAVRLFISCTLSCTTQLSEFLSAVLSAISLS